MLTEGLIHLGTIILNLLLDLLPDSTDALDLPTSSALSSTIGGYLGPFDNIAPIHEAISAIWFVLSVLAPPLFVYIVVVWAYGWLPFIGKK